MLNDSADNILKILRLNNVKSLIIGTLNINSTASKLDQLRKIIGNHIDILTIQETKLDASFTLASLMIEGYGVPHRLDRNRNGGGVSILGRTFLTNF